MKGNLVMKSLSKCLKKYIIYYPVFRQGRCINWQVSNAPEVNDQTKDNKFLFHSMKDVYKHEL